MFSNFLQDDLLCKSDPNLHHFQCFGISIISVTFGVYYGKTEYRDVLLVRGPPRPRKGLKNTKIEKSCLFGKSGNILEFQPHSGSLFCKFSKKLVPRSIFLGTSAEHPLDWQGLQSSLNYFQTSKQLMLRRCPAFAQSRLLLI